MADDDAQGFQAGQSGLIVRVPEAEPLVRAWRNRLDPSARAGVPAHVTVLFPFLDASRIDEGVCAAIGEVLGRHESFEARFDHCGRFPGVLYLAPEPDTGFRRLTEAIVERWPESPPFSGQFDDVVPHLTVAQGQDEAVLEKAEADLLTGHPVVTQVSAVDLLVHDGTRWRQRASFPLA
ncbi:2'-5' RNA ligase family protein [Streptomyces chiangmaiensis]|uniref:2'-5' RNA ligase family protein n=1 Tax=Streptomyces chiangmaiensis TaxID=766497 RepID=A0ABU7FTC6_9ACTN|nr:2'-5' RNA ligase family protein [Streptomyces chiangmaiensis]MED7827361.1 2'-5' RNA ligase family protein [Streptomyces chiangmaiensis]